MPTAAPVEDTILTFDLITREQEAEPCENRNCDQEAYFAVILISAPGCTHVSSRHLLCGPCKEFLIEEAKHDRIRCRTCKAPVKIKSVWKIR